jgi:hypothetical protein
MNAKRTLSGFALAVLAFAPVFAATTRMSLQSGAGSATDLTPTGKGWGQQAPHINPGKKHGGGGGGGGGQYGIYYHNGPIITGTTAVYYIYYGNWAASQKTILGDFASTIGGSPYFNINTTYWGANNTVVSNSVRFGGTAIDNYSQGTSLSDGAIYSIVQNAIGSGALPKDANGVYFVLTSPDVDENTGFCSSYCGWHTNGGIQGTDIKYSFVGNSDRCPSACEEQTSSSPNGDTGVDGMISVIAHELEESVTDPDLNAWFDTFGRENADKCAWTFGSTYTAPNGSIANVHLGARDYLIQQNWVNASNAGCRMSW